jgi:hypothetical protein
MTETPRTPNGVSGRKKGKTEEKKVKVKIELPLLPFPWGLRGPWP